MAIASLVLGIIAALGSFILMYITWYLSIPGLILGIISFVKNDDPEDKNRKIALFGMIINGVAIALGLIMTIVWFMVLGANGMI